jgi:hypothetical protein
MDYQFSILSLRKKLKTGYNRKEYLKVEADFVQQGGLIMKSGIDQKTFSSSFINNGNGPDIVGMSKGSLAIASNGKIYKTTSALKRKLYVGGIWVVTDYVTIKTNNPSLFEKTLALADFINAGGVVIIGSELIVNGQQLIDWFVKQ